MKNLEVIAITFIGQILQQALATDWYFLEYNPASGENFTSFSGDMAAPTLPSAATYYLWPGLQPTDNSGVYQNVLDGRSGTWWFGSGWCCSDPTLAWGGGFNVADGATVTFSNVQQSNGSWTSTITDPTTGDSATNNFALEGKDFNQAIFAIELDGPSWDFGTLAYSNVVITSSGTDSSWCTDTPTNYDDATVYSISGVSSTVGSDEVTCTIESLVLESPA
ncbi:hypothetical protein UA08_08080 [Talaromyces atroroseus]|uniref:Uncharacterized protein n=1 Tax=Talaromyces atroroseus TaxID=1441469 RepID=A0A225ACG3_TALAT|nr:hypothetical protein UA08_08080 [Talaromyces atroroseus]OKL56563.1 hypothetical protein UA08_08080 [Talaromyces atroroseus]